MTESPGLHNSMDSYDELAAGDEDWPGSHSNDLEEMPFIDSPAAIPLSTEQKLDAILMFCKEQADHFASVRMELQSMDDKSATGQCARYRSIPFPSFPQQLRHVALALLPFVRLLYRPVYSWWDDSGTCRDICQAGGCEQGDALAQHDGLERAAAERTPGAEREAAGAALTRRCTALAALAALRAHAQSLLELPVRPCDASDGAELPLGELLAAPP
eukprot:s8635_g1.t1